MREQPDTRYTDVDGFAIAFQIVGNGRQDLLYLPQFVSNVEEIWRLLEHARFMDRLASFSRLIVMDPRGTGCSDRTGPGEAPRLDGMVDDVLGVAAAAASFKTTIFGGGRSAFVAMLAAATHPAIFERLIVFGGAPTWTSDDLPWPESEEECEQDLAMFRRLPSSLAWAESWVRSYAPSLLEREGAVRAMASYEANTRAMGAGVAMDEAFRRVDLRALLPSIRVPTLILHRIEDPLGSVESGRYLAKHIPGATLVELDGVDALPWVGDTSRMLDEIELFITGEQQQPLVERAVTTILFTDIVDSTKRGGQVGERAWSEIRDRHDAITRSNVARRRGREIKAMGDGFLVAFDGPARGVRCAQAIVAEVGALGIEVRTGLHTGEVSLEQHDVTGIAVSIGARVGALARPSEVLVTQTVKDLTSGSGFSFEDAGEHELKGVPDPWRLFRVVA